MEHLGLVGLADSGHDGVFAALTGHDASSAADRVLGVVTIPDDRLDRLAEMSRSKQVVRASWSWYSPPTKKMPRDPSGFVVTIGL